MSHRISAWSSFTTFLRILSPNLAQMYFFMLCKLLGCGSPCMLYLLQTYTLASLCTSCIPSFYCSSTRMSTRMIEVTSCTLVLIWCYLSVEAFSAIGRIATSSTWEWHMLCRGLSSHVGSHCSSLSGFCYQRYSFSTLSPRVTFLY